MSQEQRVLKSMVALLWSCFLGLEILAQSGRLVVQSEISPTDFVHRIQPGSTAQMHKDWRAQKDASLQPDRSYRSIWVRMFPLLSRPYGDPYPVTKETQRAMLYNSRTLQLRRLTTMDVMAEGRRIEFLFDQNRVRVDGEDHKLEALWVVPKNKLVYTTMRWDRGCKEGDKSLEVGLELRGEFIVKPTRHRGYDDKFWSIVNVLTLSEYLYAVLPSEMPLSFENEALKTQAVAARTYALYQMAVARGQALDRQGVPMAARGWDVDPTTWYQSYRGVFFKDQNDRWQAIEWPLGRWAVDSTRGDVLIHEGEVLKAFFSASSGGQTCTAKECFGWSERLENPGYLQPVEDAPGIREAPYGTWGQRSNITPATIRQRLLSLDFDPDIEVLGMRSHRISETGRTWSLEVATRAHGTLVLDRRQTKRMLGLFGPIRSHMFRLFPMRGGRQGVIGHGYGHGVGMSQWGAELFARQGRDYKAILEHFYTDASVVNLLQAGPLHTQ